MRLGRFRSLFSSSATVTEIKGVQSVPTKSVLLLEDDLLFARTVRDYLDSHFYDVTMVADGTEGVRKVMSQQFDFVVCDIMMPKLAGDMFYRAVERINEELCRRFIFISGYQGNPRVQDFIRSIKGYSLTKPFHMSDLLEMIRAVEKAGNPERTAGRVIGARKG